MKHTFFKIVSLSIYILILGCNNAKEEKTIIGAINENCESPSDAIVKFKSVTEDDITTAILDFASAKNIVLSDMDAEDISNWVNNRVFSHIRGNHLVKEWNINDPDICFTQNTRFSSRKDSTEVSHVTINICNTILTKDVSAGNYWVMEADNFILNLSYCFESRDYITPVGYYEIIDKYGKLERRPSNLRKYSCLVYVNLTFFDKRTNTEYYQQIATDKAFLYTAFRNWIN